MDIECKIRRYCERGEPTTAILLRAQCEYTHFATSQSSKFTIGNTQKLRYQCHSIETSIFAHSSEIMFTYRNSSREPLETNSSGDEVYNIRLRGKRPEREATKVKLKRCYFRGACPPRLACSSSFSFSFFAAITSQSTVTFRVLRTLSFDFAKVYWYQRMHAVVR